MKQLNVPECIWRVSHDEQLTYATESVHGQEKREIDEDQLRRWEPPTRSGQPLERNHHKIEERKYQFIREPEGGILRVVVLQKRELTHKCHEQLEG